MKTRTSTQRHADKNVQIEHSVEFRSGWIILQHVKDSKLRQ
jgi:hypothetical protein